MEVPRNPLAPHIVLVNVTWKTMEKMTSGELTGDPVGKGSKLVALEGRNLEEVTAKLNKFLENIKNG